MSWRDKLQAASFRGAGFFIEEAESAVGRRTVVHTYPGRDLPYAEDMGRRARGFSLEGVVLGADYMADRDALLAACEEAGPGTLVHPYLGTMQVTCLDCVERESAKAGGAAMFRMYFIEAGQRNYPTQTTDYSAQAADSAAALTSVAGDVFAEVYRVAGPAWLKAAAAGDLRTALNLVQAVASAIPSPFDSLQVSQLWETIEQAANQVDYLAGNSDGALVATVADVLTGLTGLTPTDTSTGYPTATVAAALEVAKYGEATGSEEASVYGGTLAAVPALTETRETQAANQTAMVELVRQMAAAVGVTAALAVDYENYDQAADTRDALLACLDGLMAAAADDRAYEALRTLYADTVAAFREMGATLARLKSYRVPPAVTPVLAIAYDLYEDNGREEEIIKRNNIRHPGLPPGGGELQVLDA